jgi:hypothetical protein
MSTASWRWVAVLLAFSGAHVAEALGTQCTFTRKMEPHIMYASLSPDAGAKSLSECRSSCCTNATCTTYQWSDAPKTPPKCWIGDSDGTYVDSGGVVWEGASGKLDGAACDLAACTCDGVDLSSLAGRTYELPVGADGYAYMVSVCTEIPPARLPAGCSQYAQNPTAVRYKPMLPADCIQVRHARAAPLIFLGVSAQSLREKLHAFFKAAVLVCTRRVPNDRAEHPNSSIPPHAHSQIGSTCGPSGGAVSVRVPPTVRSAARTRVLFPWCAVFGRVVAGSRAQLAPMRPLGAP